MTVFPDQASVDYDARIPALVPGYHVVIEQMACHLAARFDGRASILVPGCGTGNEILALAHLLPLARFTAFDPSPGMLGAARARISAAGLGARTTLVCGSFVDLPDEKHDAATLSLVLHFLPDDGSKTAFLAEIARRLGKDAPLMVFDALATEADDRALRVWLQSQGHDAEGVDGIFTRMRSQWHRTAPERLPALLAEAGFGPTHSFFRTCGFQGAMAERMVLR